MTADEHSTVGGKVRNFNIAASIHWNIVRMNLKSLQKNVLEVFTDNSLSNCNKRNKK